MELLIILLTVVYLGYGVAEVVAMVRKEMKEHNQRTGWEDRLD